MTACAYISPKGHPALIADTLVSLSDLDPGLHRRPTSVNVERDQVFVSSRVARKLYILNRRAAVAVAGNELNVTRFLKDAADQIDLSSMTERPMQQIGALADDYGDIQVIGAYRFEDDRINEVGPRNNSFELPHLGECKAIGSGATDLKRLLSEYDQQLPRSGNLINEPLEAIRGVASAVNAKMLVEELVGINRSWGAFVEHAWFDHRRVAWNYGPPSLYGFFWVRQLGPTSFTLELDPLFFAYDPNPYVPRILAVSGRTEKVQEWVLDDVLRGNSVGYRPTMTAWRHWQPLSGTFSVILDRGGGNFSHMGMSTEWHQTRFMRFSCSEAAIRMELDYILIDHIGRMIAPALRGTYVPLSYAMEHEL